MGLAGTYTDGVVVVGGDARQRLHDARGYGYPRDGNEIALAPVEAAHLLVRDSLETVTVDGEPHDLRGFLTSDRVPPLDVELAVYADLRERGYYLVPAAEPWTSPAPADFAVYERGEEPPAGAVAFHVTALGEGVSRKAGELAPGVLAVVDAESEVTYVSVEDTPPPARGEPDGPAAGTRPADLVGEHVIVWGQPGDLYEGHFFGRPRTDDGALQCSLLEGVYLAERDVIDLDPAVIAERGRSLTGEQFDRRLVVYRRLRERGAVPKTGYKFGADFRVYPAVTSVAELDHSTHLVRVVSPTATLSLRDVARDVRLAHGVRKTMVLGVVEDDSITWRALERLTP